MLSCPGVLRGILLGEGPPGFLDQEIGGRGGRNKVSVTDILKLSPHNRYVPAGGVKSSKLTFTLDPTKWQTVDTKPTGSVEGHVGEPCGFFTDSGLSDQGDQPATAGVASSSTSPALPFRDPDGKSHKPLPLGVENDRVFNDLWGKGNMPVVLNNPHSEKEQVSGGVSLGPTLHGSLNVLGKTSAKPPWGEN